MQDEFRCQNPRCGTLIEGRGRMREDPKTGCLAVVCPHCSSKHVAVENLGVASGPNRFRFELSRDPGDGTGGSTGDGGG